MQGSAVYAVMGIANRGLATFAPYLMGVKRGVTTSPDVPATNENIVLDMYLDLTVPITIDAERNRSRTNPRMPRPGFG